MLAEAHQAQLEQREAAMHAAREDLITQAQRNLANAVREEQKGLETLHMVSSFSVYTSARSFHDGKRS